MTPNIDDDDVRCVNCRYWLGLGNYRGSCHRKAPSPKVAENIRSTTEFKAQWPITGAEDWCGDFDPTAQLLKEYLEHSDSKSKRTGSDDA